MTREEICTTCDQFTGDACRKIGCCSNPDVPSPTTWRRRLGSAHGQCPLAKWSDVVAAPAPPQVEQWLTRRVAVCLACASFRRDGARWACACDGKGLNIRIRLKAEACPYNPPKWSAE